MPTPTPETRTLKDYLLSLTGVQRATFLAAFGGGAQSFEAVVEGIKTPETERAACRKVKQLFGVTIPTAEERAERLLKLATATADRAGEAATRSEGAAGRAASEAASAAEAARQALAVARRNTVLAAAAVVAAVAALVVGLLK
jgi:hypothetical protein